MTTAEEIYQQTNPRQYSKQDAEVFNEAVKALGETGFDFVTDDGKAKNTDLIDNFYQSNRSIPVTLDSLYGFIQEHKSEFVSISPARRDYYKVAAENLDAAVAIENWYQAQNILVKDNDDQLFSNLKELLVELRGRAVNAETIHQAIQRNQTPPSTRFNTNPHRKPLHFIPPPHRVDPRSHAHPDRGGEDAHYKTGQFITGANKTPADHAREAREYHEKNNPQPKSAGPVEPVDAWQTICKNMLRDGTHGMQAALLCIYERCVSENKQWRETYTEMEAYKQSRNRLIPNAKF
jgi:hypothetical protein